MPADTISMASWLHIFDRHEAHSGRPTASRRSMVFVILSLSGCAKSPPTAFSHRSEAHRTARVRFASSLAAALLDDLFAHPAGYSDTHRPLTLPEAYCAKIDFFRIRLGRHEIPGDPPHVRP